MTDPALRVISLGAGVQSTALLLLAAQGKLPKPDAAIFADTGWEPRAVYDHLDRIERELAASAGIPVYRVTQGNLRSDSLDASKRYASMPLHIRHADGNKGIGRRQCTHQYKVRPIRRQIRELIGYPHPARIPSELYVEQWIGISTDEADRAESAEQVKFVRNRFPLLELGMSRVMCRALLDRAGFESTPKSACIGCPYRPNASWRKIRDETPDEWADAVDFDERIRHDPTGRFVGQRFLHSSALPLASAPIDRDSYRVWAGRQGDVLQLLALDDFEESIDADALTGCSPFGCVSDAPRDESGGL